jgi:hypothetical protein
MDAQTHASRKIKRSHAGDDTPAAKRHQPASNKLPPSPPRSRASSVEMKDAADSPSASVDLSTVNDEIVEAVIVQLQNAGNRPHIVKELVPVLMRQLKIVQQYVPSRPSSVLHPVPHRTACPMIRTVANDTDTNACRSANPSAIISSRLSTYLKRSCWNANNPCPMAKELETVHPRRTYFYLTTCPHGPLPEPTMAALAAAQARTLVTPSATSASEDAEDDRRRELSPSPEVDLSSPEFDDVDDDMPMPATPVGSFSGRPIPTLALPVQTQRGASPPLEKDEKEFTQTADGLQKRKLSGGLLPVKSELVVQSTELDEHTKDDNLFGEPKANAASSNPPPMAFMASPAMRPAFSINTKKEGDMDSWAKLDSLLEWDRSPETIELDELDCLLNDY